MIKETFLSLISTIKSNMITIFGIITALLSPIKYLMILVGVFIIIDTIFGIYTSKKLGVKLTSRKLSKFISKMLVYQSVVILAFAIDKLLIGDLLLLVLSVPLTITKIVTLALVINESFSIDEKLRMVNKERGVWFYFKRTIGVAKLIKKETEKIKE